MANKWKMNRAGLLNFWYYDEETFDFENGKLLLRGSNGSGKSVTMQSFLPVLLDGKKSPDRLDPFGSKSRRMEDYLLGEKEITDREERTGYLFLEYKKQDTDQYVTTGIGMQAKRGKDLKSWGFVITDNRRIGFDLELYKTENQNGERVKIPRSRIELENLIGTGGEVVKTNQEYMALVNKHVFGFDTPDAYKELIELLLQLRSPKLSKDFRPTVIYEILESALPPLTDEDLRYLSDSIEQMDQTKQQIEQLDREVKALGRLTKAYDAYNHRVLADQIAELKRAVSRVKKEREDEKEMTASLGTLESDIAALEREVRDYERREEALKQTKDRLMSHRVWSLEEERKKAQEAYAADQNKFTREEERLAGYETKERQSRRLIGETEEALGGQLNALENHLQDMAYEGEMSGFGQHEQNASDFGRHLEETFSFGTWESEAAAHHKRLEDARTKLQAFEALKEKIAQKRKEIGDVEKQRDDKQQEAKGWSITFEEDKQEKLNGFHEWAQANSRYGVDGTAHQQAARLMDGLYADVSYDDVKRGYQPFVQAYDDRLQLKSLELQNELNVLRDKREDKAAELDKRKAQRDPEPERHAATMEARRVLSEQGAVFAPLYEVVEFQPHVPAETQKRLEAALIDAGLLDALVTEQAIDIRHDRVLAAEPVMLAHTLADYLRTDPGDTGISAEQVKEVLQSVLVGDNGGTTGMEENGAYALGILTGHAVPVDDVRYVGREARRRNRERLIHELETEIASINDQVAVLTADREAIASDLATSKTAWQAFPGDSDLKTSFSEIMDAKRQIEFLSRQIEQAAEGLRKMDSDFQQLKRDVHEATGALGLEASSEAYREALGYLRTYEQQLAELRRKHLTHLHTAEKLKNEQERLENLMMDIDELKGELNVLEGALAVAGQTLRQLEEQLAQEGADDIRAQIRSVQDELRQTETGLTERRKTLPERTAERTVLAGQLATVSNTLAFWTNMQASWEKAVQAELKRGFIPLEESEREDLAKVEAALAADMSKDKSQIDSQLTRVFFDIQTELAEQRPRERPVQVQPEDWMTGIDSDEWLPIIEQWKQKTSRRLIDFDSRGVAVTPYALYAETADAQLLQENRLNEQDKELYEEILFNSVGHKLRSRIRRAEHWTEGMKKLMEDRDTSSGLKFSIRWKPRSADSEDQLDTKDLVSLLKQDAKLLREEDTERISAHFRSKIEAAKQWMEEKGEGQTLLQVLKHVLDYRKWFSFELSYERTNEKRRELTNHKFFTFSGGEKAMAMYIPLFTACYSRYLEAADTAPYIITLDEAFAGVDENNIKEMFEVVEQLGFDYIMNSQVLWGDYETVSGLSVCELVRPRNADFVTVIRYKWDGRALVPEQDPEGVLVE
ncbi:TIGR02680 family protein [Planococcus lenghuensis]|uniref:TIGR02680 family protein n=1 Tax=Planococcus lenghuensis TaxID=2213202 RepID=A0A1Q2KVQ2_9BACL|nr:TIGR02680 family protein [Planococcus lenghuensis]AQQ52269.1 TIGR02680 family protein [Planococcus lenghuensis]